MTDSSIWGTKATGEAMVRGESILTPPTITRLLPYKCKTDDEFMLDYFSSTPKDFVIVMSRLSDALGLFGAFEDYPLDYFGGC